MDSLREMNCRLDVIGMGFKREKVEEQQAKRITAAADDDDVSDESDESSDDDDDWEGDDSDGDEDEDNYDLNDVQDQNEVFFTMDERNNCPARLLAIVETTHI